MKDEVKKDESKLVIEADGAFVSKYELRLKINGGNPTSYYKFRKYIKLAHKLNPAFEAEFLPYKDTWDFPINLVELLFDILKIRYVIVQRKRSHA